MSFSFKEIFNPGKILVKDPAVPAQKVTSEPVVLKENFAAFKAAAASSTTPTPRTTDPSVRGRVILPVEEAKVEIVQSVEPVVVEVAAPIQEAKVEIVQLTPPSTSSVEVPVTSSEIGPDHLLGAPIPDTEKIIQTPAPEAIVPPKIVEPHFSVKIDGQNESIRNFLPEIFNLFRVGKELDALIIKRREDGEIAEKAKAESHSASEQASLIRSSMTDFFQSTNLETSREKLKEALEAYEKFLAAFETDKVGQDNLLRGADNKLLVQINSAKANLSGLIKVVGSREIFDTIKEKAFKALNRLRGSIPGYESKIIQDLHRVLDQKQPADAKILRDLAQSKEEGRIIDIFKILYGI